MAGSRQAGVTRIESGQGERAHSHGGALELYDCLLHTLACCGLGGEIPCHVSGRSMYRTRRRPPSSDRHLWAGARGTIRLGHRASLASRRSAPCRGSRRRRSTPRRWLSHPPPIGAEMARHAATTAHSAVFGGRLDGRPRGTVGSTCPRPLWRQIGRSTTRDGRLHLPAAAQPVTTWRIDPRRTRTGSRSR